MTIKVTKPAVNLREELTDLKQPYPIQGSVDGNDAARERLGIENHDQLTIGTDGVVDNFTSTGIDDNADATAITIDVNENVGIGVVPENGAAGHTMLRVGTTTSVLGSANTAFFSNNYYYDGTNRYITTNEATRYKQGNDGSHQFHVAPSGTAGNAISWTTAMTIANDGTVTYPRKSIYTFYQGMPESTHKQSFKISSSTRKTAYVKITVTGHSAQGLSMSTCVMEGRYLRQDGDASFVIIDIKNPTSRPSLSRPVVDTANDEVIFGIFTGNNGTSTTVYYAIEIEIQSATPNSITVTELPDSTSAVDHTGESLSDQRYIGQDNIKFGYNTNGGAAPNNVRANMITCQAFGGGYTNITDGEYLGGYEFDVRSYIASSGTGNTRDIGMFAKASKSFDSNNSGANLVFRTGSNSSTAERMIIDDSGNVEINNGNLIIGTSGKGIDFSANGNAGDMTSELLDDYETGVHYFTVTGGTSGSWTPRSGWHRMAYTKIGRQVTVTGQIEVSGSSSPVGECRVSLPFTIGSTDARFSGRTALPDIRGQGQSVSGRICADATNGNAYIRLMQVTDAGSLTVLDENHLDASWEFNISLTYFTS